MDVFKKKNDLQDQIMFVNENSKFYQKLFITHNIDPSTIKTINDLKRLPTVSKQDLQNYNSDFFCIPSSEFSDLVTTSGTLGKPVTVPLSKHDLERLAINEANSFRTAGVTSKDVIQLMVTMDARFMAGLAYYLGIQKIGATSIRIGPASPLIQLENIKKFNPTVIVGVPSFINKIIDYSLANNIDLNSTSVKRIICIGNPIRNEDMSLNFTGKHIIDNWNVALHSSYASTEMATAFTECSEGNGGHLQEDLLVVEILDENGNNVEVGQKGEVTITNLGVEAMPLIRFKTGDIAYLINDKCGCGNESVRLSSIIGRKEQMIKLKGTTIYPPAIIDVLNEMIEILNYYIEISSDEFGLDTVKVVVSSKGKIENVKAKLRDNFSLSLRVIPEIEFDSFDLIYQKINFKKGRKQNVIFDKRELQ